MWFQTMWHFEMKRLKQVLGLETANDVWSLA